ncbi:MAG: C45 family autoproteolytic acyltransferase/hydrolase [Acidaminococcaceae bacterium]
MIILQKLLLNLLITITMFFSVPVEACTLWAVNGSMVDDGGTLIVKNRDWEPNQYQVIKFVPAKDGYSYFGLYAEGTAAGMKAGINEKGLVVVSATAGSIPSKERKNMPNKAGSMTKLLKECASVEEALTRTDLFLGPKILMLADKKSVATIEIGPEGKFSIDKKQNDYICHTNHYVTEDMLNFNKKIGQSSEKRYERICQLLDDASRPFSLDVFLNFSSDQNDGPDDSIFRIGSTSAKTRTMAVWAVSIPMQGSPEVYIRILNPNEEEKSCKIIADDFFSAQAILNKM